MPYAVTPLPFKPSQLNGLSERLLASHYENNYGGALRRLGQIQQELKELDIQNTAGFYWNGLKREELIAANSVILHELYFNALGGDGRLGSGVEQQQLASTIERDFGSVDRWRSEFTALGTALGGGSGWVILCWSERQQRLVNSWSADHAHMLADCRPILPLDMYEHAYHLDFGAKAAAYVDAFLRNIDWSRVTQAFLGKKRSILAENAVTVEELRLAMNGTTAPLILDVRKAEDLASGSDMIEGAVWRDPDLLSDWHKTLSPQQAVIVYCVYGFHVSQNTAASLRTKGIEARSLSGGIAAWHAAGLPTQSKA